MVKILNIDTSTPVCSVALAEGNNLISYRESREGKNHALLLGSFIDEVLKEGGIKTQELDAVSVSKGPGSYTGLRIGVSTAKGLAYGISKPLISIETLLLMAQGYIDTYAPQILKENTLLCPMIDARRMEVYSAIYKANLTIYRDVLAEIIDGNSFSDIPENISMIFFGDGSAKCIETIKRENILLDTDFSISAKSMINLSLEKYQNNFFEDTAYFEPFYLKDFIATVPGNKVLK